MPKSQAIVLTAHDNAGKADVQGRDGALSPIERADEKEANK